LPASAIRRDPVRGDNDAIVLCPMRMEGAAQRPIDLHQVEAGEHGVVPVGQRCTARDDPARRVMTDGLDPPRATDPLQVADVVTRRIQHPMAPLSMLPTDHEFMFLNGSKQDPAAQGSRHIGKLGECKIGVLGIDVDHYIAHFLAGLQILDGDVDVAV
jgi:hypothetical protein